MDFNQDIFVLVANFNNQAQQLDLSLIHIFEWDLWSVPPEANSMH